MGPYEPVVSCDTADVLRTVPGKVIGPGHGSAVVGPDNLTEYLAYHAWDIDHTGRFLHVDRLVWDGGRPVSPGPRTDPQPSPAEPFFRDLVGRPSGRGATGWRLERPWTSTAHELRHHGGASPATATVDRPAPGSFLFEVNLALAATAAATASYGVTTAYRDDRNHAVVSIDPHRSELRWRVLRHGDVQEQGVLGSLRRDFSIHAYHQLVIRQGPDEVAVSLDGVIMGTLPAGAPASDGRVGVWTNGAPLSAVGVTLTELSRTAEPGQRRSHVTTRTGAE
jgi:hypothetical protein